MSRLDPGLGESVVVEHSNEVYVVDGERRSGVNVAMSAETFEQYRNGYRCLKCHGIQDEAFPEVCKVRDLTGTWKCGFPMRAEQLRYLEIEHRGSQWYGPSPDDRDDWDDEDERAAWAERTGVWLPGTND